MTTYKLGTEIQLSGGLALVEDKLGVEDVAEVSCEVLIRNVPCTLSNATYKITMLQKFYIW